MGIDKFLRNIAVKGISTLVGSVSIGYLTVKSGTAITGAQTLTGSVSVGNLTANSGATITGATNITGATAVNGNLTVASRFIGVQGLTQGKATMAVGSTYVVITTAAVSSQTAYSLHIVTAAASARLLDLSVDSVVAGASFAIVAPAASPEAMDIRWLIIG